jgi:hypothetical protein
MVLYVPVKHESHAARNSDYMQTGLPALVGAAKYIMVVNIHEGTSSMRRGTNISEQVPRGIGLEGIFLVLGLILYNRKGNNFLVLGRLCICKICKPHTDPVHRSC